MTTTTRRTARLSKGAQPAKLAALLETPVALAEEPKKKRGYVAVNFSFDARTDTVFMTARQDMTIEGENGASVALKAGEQFYAVRASSLGENMWYIVRSVSGEKKCSCPANKPCKHEKLVATIKVAAKPIPVISTKEADQKYAILRCDSILDRQKIREHAEKDLGMQGNLNGNKAFSLLR